MMFDGAHKMTELLLNSIPDVSSSRANDTWENKQIYNIKTTDGEVLDADEQHYICSLGSRESHDTGLSAGSLRAGGAWAPIFTRGSLVEKLFSY